MKNIEYLLSELTSPLYNRSQMLSIIKTECKVFDTKVELSMCMEEFAELIEVITDNIIRERIDYIHLKEEMSDCYICIDKLRIIFGISNSDIDIPGKNHVYGSTNLLNNCIFNLSVCIQKLSKCIREKSNANTKMIGVINTINETLYNLEKYYKIDSEDILKITQLKIKRMNDRNISAIKELKRKPDSIPRLGTSTEIKEELNESCDGLLTEALDSDSTDDCNIKFTIEA